MQLVIVEYPDTVDLKTIVIDADATVNGVTGGKINSKAQVKEPGDPFAGQTFTITPA